MTAVPISRKFLASLPAVMMLAMLLALVGAYGAFGVQQAWGLPLFGVALAIGFGAQLWFITRLIRGGRS